ncbi:bifunctional UBX domain/Thioredoxin-like superfamily/Ubiquitin-like domain superfamily [Babesia duncani]|uniref:Bifunctional UBX domain/Thioredoxin-like superfamily/Ubiquitin-like domain superfamily n=1 Tax=Babesia duncani TaxID=323732 RepID=A0AAD9UPQ9_9APIC|nr:bifunctional UBX domain/Thioredoxin-like superfamily/Ubiquitin-like domain superfamily [Babesia duncani]
MIQAKAAALSQGKILALYLHNERAQNFCCVVLSNPLVIELLDTNYILYVVHSKGVRMRLMSKLAQAHSIPHISFFRVPNHNELFYISGTNQLDDTDSFIAMIMNLAESRVGAPTSAIVEEERKIRGEQDEEFKRAMAIDYEKMTKRNIMRRETEKRIKEELDIKQKKGDIKRQTIERRKKISMNYSQSTLPLDTKIKVRLPNGATVESKFNHLDTVGKLYEWVEIVQYTAKQDNLKIPINFTLNITHPSTSLLDKTVTLEAANLFPDAVLTLISLDSDEETESE